MHYATSLQFLAYAYSGNSSALLGTKAFTDYFRSLHYTDKSLVCLPAMRDNNGALEPRIARVREGTHN